MKSKTIKQISKISVYLCSILVLISPFHALISTFLLHQLGLNDFTIIKLAIQAWKEALIIILLAITGLLLINKVIKWHKLATITISFSLVAVLTTLLFAPETNLITAFIWGIRTEILWLYLGLAIFLLAPLWSDKDRQQLTNHLIIGLILSLFIAFVLQISGHELLVHLGFRNDWSTFYLDQAPAFCQKEAGTEFCRWQGGFAGPNRFAAYLLAFIPLLYIKRSWLILTLCIIALFATLSQSAIIAFIVGASIYTVIKFRLWQYLLTKIILACTVVTIGLLGIFFVYSGPPSGLDISSQEHIVKFGKGLGQFSENPLGAGLSATGPAAFKLGATSVPENWFLQVLINQGIIGLFLYLAWWFYLLKSQIGKQKNKPEILFLTICPAVLILIQSFFLHPFEDFGVTTTMFVIISLISLNNFSIDKAN